MEKKKTTTIKINPATQDWQQVITSLKQIQHARAVTDDDIAQLTGIHRSNVTRFFNVHHSPKMDTFFTIAKVLQVRIELKYTPEVQQKI